MADLHSARTIKTLGEALRYAECAVVNFYPTGAQRAHYAEVLAELLADVGRQRPTGPDGKHGDRHTPTCGCEDRKPMSDTTNRDQLATERSDDTTEEIAMSTPDPVDPIPADDSPHAYVAVKRTHSVNADRPEWHWNADVIPVHNRAEIDLYRRRGFALIPIGPDGDTGTRAITNPAEGAAMLSYRDALADLIAPHLDSYYGIYDGCDAAIAAGWRPSARVITDPAEADELPDGTVILVAGEVVAARISGVGGVLGRWWQVLDGDAIDTAAELMDLSDAESVTVVHVPTEEA